MRATEVLQRGYAAFGQVIAHDSRQLHSALCNVENYIDEPWVQAFYNRYLECFIEDNVTFGSNIYELEAGRRGTPALHLFVELARAHFILRYRQLMQEVATGQGMIRFSLSQCQLPIWTLPDEVAPVMTYSQSQITSCLLWLSRRLDDIQGYTEETETELAQIVNVLMTRNSVFFCEACQGTTLDLEHMRVGQGDGSFVPSRDYVMFVTIYFNAIMRRLYYLDKAKRKLQVIPVEAGRVEAFIRTRISEEVYETLYEAAVVRSFTCPGDKAWFTYRNPNRADTDLAMVLAEARENDEVDEFRTWIRNPPSIEVVLAAAFDQEPRLDLISRIGRNLVLLILDTKIRELYNVRWFNAVLVPNEAIERSAERLVRPKAPMLVQLFGGDYWIQGKAGLYAPSGITELISTWFWLLRTEFNSQLHQVDMSMLCDTILDLPPDLGHANLHLGIQPL